MKKRSRAKVTPRRAIGDEVAGISRALERAAQRAREIAFRTGTPIVVFRNGRIEWIPVTRLPGKSAS